MKIDNKKSEYLNILDHINQLIPDTDPKILEGQISFSHPRVLGVEDLSLIPNDRPNDTYIYNTEITVSPSPAFSWEKPTQVQYRRVDLSKQFLIWTGEHKGTPSNPLIYHIPNQATTSRALEKENVLEHLLDLLPFLRKASLRVEDGFDRDRYPDRPSEAIFSILPIENSLLYVGGIYIKGTRERGDDIVIPPPPIPKVPLGDIFTPDKTDTNQTLANQGDGFEYDEEII